MLIDAAQEIDQVQAFMAYTLFGGNAKRTAMLMRVTPEVIESLAHDYNWKTKLAGKVSLETEEGREQEREMNRVSSYVVAERLGRVIGNLIAKLDNEEDPSKMLEFFRDFDETGQAYFSVKNMVDLTKALQTVNDIKYRALGDKIAEEADTSDGKMGTTKINAINIYKAIQNRFDAIPAIDTAASIAEVIKDDTRSGI